MTTLASAGWMLVAAIGLAMPGVAAETNPPPRNILWDGGLDAGYGNTFWGTVLGNLGPNRRAAWRDGVVALKQVLASRVYWLAEGDYALCAWVRRAADAAQDGPGVGLELTNLNDIEAQASNSYFRKFAVPADGQWHRVGWSFKIQAPVRPMFHVAVKPLQDGVDVDAVSLTPGTELPDAPRPAADVEATFFIADESGFYVDGEERIVELVICNHGPEQQAEVHWELFDHREQPVRQGTVAETLPAGATVRKRMPMADLPYDGYRLACAVEGNKVLGDGLVACLPRIEQDPFPQYGGDAAITPWAADFMAPYMRRLGMKMVTTLSPAGVIGRWGIVEPKRGSFQWQDESVDQARAEGLDVIGFLGLKHPPAWMEDFGAPVGKDVTIRDEKAFTDELCRYVDAYVRHYAGRINVYHLEDEIHTSFPTPESVAVLARIYKAARATALKAAGGKGPIAVGVNGTQPEWWDMFIDAVGSNGLDFVSQNTNLRPQWTADTLNVLRRKGCYPPFFYTIGVGQMSVLRKTSLIQDRAIGTGRPMGLFAWQIMMHAWLSRPNGTEDVKDGPVIRYGYYDLRTLGQCLYQPNTGKTGLEFDNSPTLGLQAMALLKWNLSGLRPARDPRAAFSLTGRPAGHDRLMAYPFRDAGTAAIVLTTVDGEGVDDRWRLTGEAFAALKPANLYGRPLKIDGAVAEAVELPIVVKDIPAAELDQALAACAALKSERVVAPDQHRLQVGSYILDLNPGKPGLLQLSVKRGDKETVILDRFVADPPLPPPTVEVSGGRLASTAIVNFTKVFALGISLTEEGVSLQWRHRNSETRDVTQTLRFRVSPAGGGRAIVIQEGADVKAGRLREDYGHLFPAESVPVLAPLGENVGRVTIRDFATFELAGATGRGFQPATGFKWRTRGGEAFLESTYTVGAFKGGGSRGVQSVKMDMMVSAP